MFEGPTVALITPFVKSKKVDYEALKGLIEFQLENGTKGFVPCGTTGEAATLTLEERKKVIEKTVDFVNKKGFVIAGTGTNSTESTIELTKFAKEVGADGVLIVCPYYNKPTQEGIYQHYKKVAEGVDIPIILYNIPSRTGVNITVDTMRELSKIPNIVGVKEASGSILQVSEIVKECGDTFTVLSGEDALTLPIMSVGGKGVISATSNVAPTEMANIVSLSMENRYEEARKVHLRLLPLFKTLFAETNPGPVKTALKLMGLCDGSVRLPLVPVRRSTEELLRRVLKELGKIQ